jgi:sodium/potassium-transporting ATPase subunit alpha
MIYSPVNVVMLYGVALETFLFIFIVYVPGVNSALGARPMDIYNLGYILHIYIYNS